MDSSLPIVLSESNLGAYLAGRGVLASPKSARVRRLAGGVSNLAFWVDEPGGALVVKQARPRLAVEMEWLADVDRIIREAEAIDWLYSRLGPPRIPRLLHLDRESKAMAMEAIAPPAENYKTMMLRGEVDPGLAEQFGTLLAEIHNATCDEATRRRFDNTSYFEQLRLSPYYGTVADRHPALAGRLAELQRECLSARYCLVHGDYSPKNILVREGGLVLLDYEVAHWGNPSFDLGFALTHYLCKALHLSGRRELLLAAARLFWNSYQARIALPEASRARAGHHLAAIMLARMDGKSPLEYFTDERKRERVRRLTNDALLDEAATIPALIQAVEASPP